jgi:outer membrane protein TolC
MNLISKTMVVLFSAVLSVVSYGQTNRTLTLDELVELGMANSKQLKISSAKMLAAHSKTAQTRETTIPVLSYTGSYTRISENVPAFIFHTPSGGDIVLNPIIPNNYVNRFSVSEAVFTGLRAVNSIKANEFLERAVQFDVEKDKKDVQLNLISAGLNLYKLQEAKRVFEGTIATAKNRQADVSNLKSQGLAVDNDVLKAELLVAQLESAQIETINAIAAAQYGLNILLGLPENTVLAIDGASVQKSPVAPEGLDVLAGNAVNRADVQAASQRALASAKQLEFTKGSRWPLVSVGANLYSNRPNQRLFPPEDKFLTTWDAGVTLSWNLTNLFTSRHNIQEASANVQQSNLFRDQLNDAARSEVATNFYNWRSADQKISLAEKAVLQATENVRITKLRNDQQIASTSDLLDADALLVQTKVNQVAALADTRLAYFKLLKSAGKL